MSNAALDYLRGHEWSMGNGQCPDCHGMGPMMQSLYPHRTEIHGHDTDCKLAAAIAALSHAAGQDGEQCRAASGVEEIARQMDAMAGHIQASSPEQKSERLRGWASMLRALSRGVPEDAKRLDWVLENAAMVETDGSGQWRVRFDWTAPIMYFSYRDTPRDAIDAAIAAQRKEG